MSTQAVVPDKLRALLAMAQSAPAMQTTATPQTQTIPNVPVPPLPPQAMTRLAVPQMSPGRAAPAAQTQQPNLQQQGNAAPPAALNLSALSGGMPKLPVPTAPNVALDPQVAATQAQVAATQARAIGDMQRQQYLTNSGSGVSQITHPVDPATGQPTNQPPSMLRRFGGALARIGDTALSIVSPGVAALTPGTTLHHDLLLNQQAGIVNNDLGDEQKQAQTNLLDATPALKQQAAEIQQLRAMGYLKHIDDQGVHYNNQDISDEAKHGYKPDGKGGFVPMTYAEMSPQLQAMHDYNASRTEYENALTDLKKAQNDPSSPVYLLAKRRVDAAALNANTALSRLSLRQQEDDANYDGTYNGKPVGTFDDAGNPEGIRVANYNKPTAQERRVGDLAQSAVNQVHTMRQIVQSHPEVFGPIAGRTMTAEQWLGTQSPDAQKFLSASRYLADHSAGVFGSRSVEITRSLEQLTSPNINPAALNAALDQAEFTAQHFVNVGHLPGKHEGNAANGTSAPDGTIVKLADGSTQVKRNGKWVAQ